MRILYLSQHPHLNLMNPDGPGTHMREMINAFHSLGNDVLPLIFGRTELKSEKKNSEISFKNSVKQFVSSFVWQSLKDFQLINKNANAEKIIASHTAKFKPDLIYERTGYMQSAGIRIAKKRNIKHFAEFNAILSEEKKMLQGKSLFDNAGMKMEFEILKATDKIVVISSELKNLLLKKYNVSEKKFIISPNAVNPQKIKINKEKISELKSKLNVEGDVVIGFVGSVFPYHGVDILLDVFHRFQNKVQKAKLIVVGDGEILEQLKQKSEQLNIPAVFTGNVPPEDIYNYISLFDIAVLPKTKEYMSPIKVFEYGAMGKAIVAPDVVSVRDVMENGKHGLLIKSNVDELGLAILKLAEDENLRKQLGENFQKKVLSEHTWEKMAQKILSFA